MGARDLLRAGSYVIALEQAMAQQGLEPVRARSIIADAVNRSIMPARTALFRLARVRHRRPLDRARWGARVARRFYYTPPDWIMEDVEVQEGFGFDVTRCVVSEFFGSFGLGDLCGDTICAQDIRSAAHHGVVLERATTLATGGSRCDFRYRSTPDRRPRRDRRRRRRNSRWSSNQRAALTDSVYIDVSPERVWDWMSTMTDHYTDWHPDHVAAEWVHGRPNEMGSRMKAIEYLAGRRESLILEMTRVDRPLSLEYRILGLHGFLLPRGRFVIEPHDRGSLFTAAIEVRFAPIAALLFRPQMVGLRTHMREEGESLKRLLEAERSRT